MLKVFIRSSAAQCTLPEGLMLPDQRPLALAPVTVSDSQILDFCGRLNLWEQAGDTEVISLHLVSRNSKLQLWLAWNRKRQLNKEELKKVLEQEIQSPELKGNINADDIEQAMTLLDKNHDGEINFREFCRELNLTDEKRKELDSRDYNYIHCRVLTAFITRIIVSVTVMLQKSCGKASPTEREVKLVYRETFLHLPQSGTKLVTQT
ncbi:S100-A6-like [Solea senegalensis]|uniref:S100-A6-like n=1 Tax=Solea senegalensis TaxID=28829 RepID=A0AAV6PTZ9_SOLSE|nr:S100-A6-like [Solea senegalensis]